MEANELQIIVVKNPLSPVEHPGGVGVANELFELALDQFVKGVLWAIQCQHSAQDIFALLYRLRTEARTKALHGV